MALLGQKRRKNTIDGKLLSIVLARKLAGELLDSLKADREFFFPGMTSDCIDKVLVINIKHARDATRTLCRGIKEQKEKEIKEAEILPRIFRGYLMFSASQLRLDRPLGSISKSRVSKKDEFRSQYRPNFSVRKLETVSKKIESIYQEAKKTNWISRSAVGCLKTARDNVMQSKREITSQLENYTVCAKLETESFSALLKFFKSHNPSRYKRHSLFTKSSEDLTRRLNKVLKDLKVENFKLRANHSKWRGRVKTKMYQLENGKN